MRRWVPQGSPSIPRMLTDASLPCIVCVLNGVGGPEKSQTSYTIREIPGQNRKLAPRAAIG